MKNEKVFAIIMFVFFSGFATSAWAQQKAVKKADIQAVEDEPFTMMTVSGEVAGITKNTISLIYDRDYDTGTEYEILLPYDEDVAVKHKAKLNEIKKGDFIAIEYEKPLEGSKKVAKAKTVIFIQSAVNTLASEPGVSAAEPAVSAAQP